MIRASVVIGRDIPAKAPRAVSVPSVVESRVAPTAGAPFRYTPVFDDPQSQKAAAVTLDVIREFQRLPRSKDLEKPEIQAELVARVADRLRPTQGTLPDVTAPLETARVVAETVKLYTERAIDIPRIVVTPTGDVTSGYRDFDLDIAAIRFQPVARDILVHHLESNRRERRAASGAVASEQRPEDYVVRRLIDFDDVSYDDHADLLYKLAGQAVAHLRGYLKDDDEVENVLLYYQKQLAELIHAQQVRVRRAALPIVPGAALRDDFGGRP